MDYFILPREYSSLVYQRINFFVGKYCRAGFYQWTLSINKSIAKMLLSHMSKSGQQYLLIKLAVLAKICNIETLSKE